MIKKTAYWIFDDNFIIPTFLSVASFVNHCKENVRLIYYGSDILPVKEIFKKLNQLTSIEFEWIKSDFFRIQIHGHNTSFANHIKNRELRFYVAERANPHNAVYIFDSDILFTDGTQSLFDELEFTIEQKNIAAGSVESNSCFDNKLFFNREKKENQSNTILSHVAKMDIYQQVYGDNFHNLLNTPQLNNGVLIFYNSIELISAWKDYYEKGISIEYVNPEDDQVPLAAALRALNIHVIKLPDRYNSKGLINGDFIIYHAFAGRWKEELINALVDLPFINKDLSDFASIYKSNLHFLDNISEIKESYLSNGEPYLYNSIDGFFRTKELFNDIFYGMPVNGVFVELGTYKGKSICYLAELVKYKFKPLQLYSIEVDCKLKCRSWNKFFMPLPVE